MINLKKYLLFCILIISVTVFIYFDLKIETLFDLFVYITNFIIIILSLFFMLFGDRYNYSLNKIFYLFSLFFFGISPILEYKYKVSYWGKDVVFSDYLKMNIIIIFIIIAYQILYIIFLKKNFSKKYLKYLKKLKLQKKVRKQILYMVPLSIFVYYCLKFNFNLKYLFINTTEKKQFFKNDSQIYMLIFSNFIKPLVLFALIIIKQANLKDRKLEIFLIILTIIVYFPIADSRVIIARTYIPLLLLYISYFKKYMRLNIFLILGLLYIFPFLGQLRYFDLSKNIKLGFDLSVFLEGHFDSFQNFLRVVSSEIITTGRQLIGVFLFWIPRNIWQNKPIGSGAYLAKQLNLNLDNISMNFFGEGYINFGIIGIIIFIGILAYINSNLDRAYWVYGRNTYISIIYPSLLGMEFFILRGDLMSSFSYTLGIIVSSLFLFLLCIKRKN